MKTSKLMGLTKNLFLIISIVVIVLSFSSCATKANFLSSTFVPAARGGVTVSKDLNKNYQIKVKLYNLAEANRLDPPRRMYLVWMEAGRGNVKNLGQITSKTGFLSKSLNANLKAVSSSKPSKIFITAEDDPTIQVPMSQIILTTSDF